MNIWQGNKINLRSVRMTDLEDYYMKYGSNDSESQRNGDRVTFPYGEGVLTERVTGLTRLNPYDEQYTMIIENKEGQAVGNINSHSCEKTNGTFEYGLGIQGPFRGNGYAKEAIILLLNYYFMELGYQKAEARVYAFNEASIHIHEQLGFKREGCLRSHHYTNGRYHDEICYGMLREEYEQIHK